MFCGCKTCHCHCDIILDVKLRSQPHWIVPFSWIQELSPCPAGRALGGSLPAGDCHGILFRSQKWAWRLLRPCQRSVRQPLVLFWGFSRRQALVMVACFCCQKWAWRLLRPCQRSVPQPLVLFWGFSRRQALVMVACFAVRNGHGGCSGHVSARFHSLLSCFGAFRAGRRWSW